MIKSIELISKAWLIEVKFDHFVHDVFSNMIDLNKGDTFYCFKGKEQHNSFPGVYFITQEYIFAYYMPNITDTEELLNRRYTFVRQDIDHKIIAEILVDLKNWDDNYEGVELQL